ncbi:Exosome complex component RRP42 (Exosome component 7) (Ribosomal RNA-processing protein 42) (p8), partial [Durusdinium trenchii]
FSPQSETHGPCQLSKAPRVSMQPLKRISDSQRQFLLDGVQQNLRSDGRGPFDYRRVTFELNCIPSSTSSCRLRAGDTELLLALKCDLAKPRLQPDAGHVQVTVECAPSVSVALADSSTAEDWGRRLSVLLETLCASDSVIDRKALCLLPHVFAWQVHVDVLVLSSGGNLLDSLALALGAVLSETLLPKVEVIEALEEGEEVQLKVDDRPEAGLRFPMKQLPLCVTVAQISGKFLMDVTSEEEICAEAMLCVVVDGKTGDIIGLHKLGRGLFDVSALPSMLERCRGTAAVLVQQLDRELSLPAALMRMGGGTAGSLTEFSEHHRPLLAVLGGKKMRVLAAHKLKKHVCHGAGCAAFMGPRRPKFHEANEAEVAFDEEPDLSMELMGQLRVHFSALEADFFKEVRSGHDEQQVRFKYADAAAAEIVCMLQSFNPDISEAEELGREGLRTALSIRSQWLAICISQC